MIGLILLALVPLGVVVIVAPLPAAIAIVIVLRARPEASLQDGAEAVATVLRPGGRRRRTT